MHSRLFLVAGAIFACGHTLAAAPGTYVRAGSTNKTSAIVVVHEASAKQVVLSLEVISKPSPAATVARTGTLTRKSLPIANGAAKYEESESGAEGCTVNFRFETQRIRVKQSALCAEFGVGIDATGTYLFRKAK